MKICPACKTIYKGNERFCPDDGSELVGVADYKTGQHVGETLGDFQLTEHLHTDNYNEVYLAAGGEKVCVVLPWVGHTKAQTANYESDLNACKGLEAEGIDRCLGFDLSGDIRWTAWTNHEGLTPLGAIVENHGPAPVHTAFTVMMRAARALALLHERRVYHRNLSSSDILVSGDSWGDLAESEVVVTNWARTLLVAVKDPIAENHKSPRAHLGRPEYFSPEQAQGRASDGQSDIYSLGIVLYELITGKPPFTSGSFTTTLKRQIYEKPLLPRIARPGLDLTAEQEELVMELVAKKPDERPGGMANVAERLEKLCGTAPAENKSEKKAEKKAPDAPKNDKSGNRDTEEDDALSRATTLDEASSVRVTAPIVLTEEIVAIARERAKEAGDDDSDSVSTDPDGSVPTADIVEGLKSTEIPAVGPTQPIMPVVDADTNSSKEAATDESAQPPDIGGAKTILTGAVAGPGKTTTSEPDTAPAKGDDEDSFEIEDISLEEPDPPPSKSASGKKSKRQRRRDRKKKRSRSQEVKQLKGSRTKRPEDPLSAPAAPVNPDADKTQQIPKDTDPATPPLKIGSVPNPKGEEESSLDLEGWFSPEAAALDEVEPEERRFGGYTNVILVVVLILMLGLGVGGIYVYSQFIAGDDGESELTEAEALAKQEEAQEKKRKDLLALYYAAAEAGRLVPPAEHNAFAHLKTLKTQPGSENPQYEQGRTDFIRRATIEMENAVKEGEEKRAAWLARHVLQLDPENHLAKGVFDSEGRELPEPAEPEVVATADAGSNSDAEAAPGEDTADADEAAMSEADVEVGQEDTGTTGSEDAAVAAAAVDAGTPDEKTEPDKPEKTDKPDPVTNKVDRPKPDKDAKAEERAAAREKRKEEVRRLLLEASRARGAKAIQLYKRVITLDPRNHRAHFQLGVVLSQTGDYGGALRYLERAVQLNGRSSQYRLYLGNAYLKTGKRSKAIEQYKKVLQLDKNNAAAKRMLDRLQ